jgi:epoxyqueuosine reductase
MPDSKIGSQELEKEIKAEAYRLGFSLCGITTPEPLSNYFKYQVWLERGFNAEMKYLASDYHCHPRSNPRILMPSVRSILCLAYPYTLHLPEALSGKEKFLVAGYATGPDYHLEIPKRLVRLVSRIEAFCNKKLEFQIFTDSAPVLERELARRAGLGWIGRNSCLINPAKGSGFLLAEVFLDLELIPDNPFKDDRCGSCHRCVDACPTHCIHPDRTIDSRLCLSYHSIENKKGIPPEIGEKLPPWLFGCDICQMVCPWNKNTHYIEPPLYFTSQDLVNFLIMSPEDISLRFKESAILRAKYFGFLRNVLINIVLVDRGLSLPALNYFIETNVNSELENLAKSMKTKLEKKPSL